MVPRRGRVGGGDAERDQPVELALLSLGEAARLRGLEQHGSRERSAVADEEVRGAKHPRGGGRRGESEGAAGSHADRSLFRVGRAGLTTPRGWFDDNEAYPTPSMGMANPSAGRAAGGHP